MHTLPGTHEHERVDRQRHEVSAGVRQAMLGCAPAYRLLDFSTHRRELPGAIVDIKKSIAGSPRSFADYQVTVHEDRLPMGVQLLKLC